MSTLIPVHMPVIGESERRYVLDCLESGWISSAGDYITEFEDRWAAYCGRRHGISVSSGTAALHAAIACLDLGVGDEVILPTFTIISCVSAIIAAGATPVLVDSDAETWTLNVEEVTARITSRTRAIMPVHIYGHPVDMDPLVRLAEEGGVAVIEDAAEAHGAEYLSERGGWRRCGSFGALSCFSFFANKVITTGEGGMLVTDDARLAERARSVRNLCFQPGRRFLHDEIGANYRLTNLQAALGLGQLERIEESLERKRAIAAAYTERLRPVKALQLPVERPWARNIYWMYGVVIRDDASLDAAELAQRLRARGVDTRPFFLGMHEQPVLLRRGFFTGESYPVAERLARRGLYLPSSTTLSDEEIDRVCVALEEALS